MRDEVQSGWTPQPLFILILICLFVLLLGCGNTMRTTVKVPTLPPDAVDDETIRYLRVAEFSGDSKCAPALKSKVEALITAAPLQRYTLVQHDLQDPRETMLVEAAVDKCTVKRGRGDINAVFSLRHMGKQRKQYVMPEETNRPGASPAEIQTVLINRVATGFVKKAFPTFKKEIREFRTMGHDDPGWTAAKIQNWDSAATHWTNQLTHDPSNDSMRYNLGIVYEAKGDFLKAYESYSEANKLKEREQYLEARVRAERSLRILGQSLPEPTSSKTDEAAACEFLKEAPQPAWVTNPPDLPDRYMGVGMASRQRHGEDQLSLSAANARAELAAGIEVKVSADFDAWWEETHEDSIQNNQSKLFGKTKEEIHQKTNELLRDSKIEEMWLNREPCHLYTLVSVSRESVKRVKQELREKWQKSDLSKDVMLFDVSANQRGVSAKLKVMIENLLREMGPTIVPPNQGFESCAQDNSSTMCGKRATTIFGSVSVMLDNERHSGDNKGRYYRVQGRFLGENRTVSSFNEACQAIGPANQSSQFFDELAANNCMDKVGPILQRDFTRSIH